MKKFLFSVFIISALPIFSQNKTYQFDLFTVTIENSDLKAFDNEENIIFTKTFNHPSGFSADLDEDGIDEFIIIDSLIDQQIINYTIFLFNTIDSFYLVDSILSGITEAYYTFSEELGMTIIVTGNSGFNIFNQNAQDYFIPANCWRYESSELYLINDEVYNIFIDENENIIKFIDENYYSAEMDCSSSLEIKSAIASAYANYINAGEESVASQFLKKYYLCEDIDQFKNQLRELTLGIINENGLE